MAVIWFGNVKHSYKIAGYFSYQHSNIQGPLLITDSLIYLAHATHVNFFTTKFIVPF
jgi:hypothetical protein